MLPFLCKIDMKHYRRNGLMGLERTHTSDTWCVVAFLALSGGFQDAYSFLARGHVFANAQTGNIVLLGALAVPKLGIHAIWCSCALLAVSFALMFEKREPEHESKTEWT